MTVYRARLSKAALLKIPTEERRLFLVLGHIANEIKGIQKLLAWSSDFSSTNETIVQGRLTISMMLLKTLAGKLNEAHEVIRKYFHHPDVAQSYEKALSPKGKEALAQVKQYFGRANIVNKIRKIHAFHYSPQSIDDALESLPDDLDLYLEDKGNANNLFYFSEALAGRALLQSLKIDDERTAFGQLVQETLSVSRLVDIERHRSDIWEGNAQAVSLGELSPFGSVRIDWFTDTSDVLEKYGAKGAAAGGLRDGTA